MGFSALHQYLAGILLCLYAMNAAAADYLESDLPNTIGWVKQSVVGVGTVQPTRSPSARLLGTGFVVADGSYVLTNAHVIPEQLNNNRNESLAIFVRQGGEVQERTVTVVARDIDHDVVLLKQDGPLLPALTLGDSTQVREGQLYLFTGFPIGGVLGLHAATHRGMIASITPIAISMGSARQLKPKLIKRLADPYNIFQLDATAYPGNSGSPLYDPRSGEVIGIVNMVHVKESKESVLQKPSGISYAVPIEFANSLIKKEFQPDD